MLSPVAFLPSFSATFSQLFFSKIRYRMIRCIRSGIVSIHISTSSFIRSAAFFCSSRTFSSLRNLLSSSYVNDVPILLKCIGLYGNSGLLPETFVCTIVFRFFFNRVISFSVSFTTSHASMYCSMISFSNGTTSPSIFSFAPSVSHRDTDQFQLHHAKKVSCKLYRLPDVFRKMSCCLYGMFCSWVLIAFIIHLLPSYNILAMASRHLQRFHEPCMARHCHPHRMHHQSHLLRTFPRLARNNF